MSTEGMLFAWSDSLWNFFLPEIQSGRPFYLAVDESVLLATFPGSASDLSAGGVEDTFHNLCANHLITRGRFASLTSESLAASPNGRSLALCLAAQQVLVVARMVEDADFSADEYFPRLRKRMGLPPINSNPFSFGEFLSIWKTLEQEILAVEGASSSSITFKEVGGRKEKSRSLPLSQALLTQRDLCIIASNWDQDRERLDSAKLLRLIDRSRSQLTRRGQRLCVLEGQRGRVVNQIRDFLKKPTVPIQLPKVDAVSTRPEERSLVVFYQDCGLEERFVVRLLIGNDQESGSRLYEEIELKLRNQPFLVFEDTGVHFNELSGSRAIGALEPIMFLVCRHQKDDLTRQFSQYPGYLASELIECDFSENFCLLHFRNGLGTEIPFKTLTGDLSETVREGSGIRLIGGFVIDGRNSTYLVGRTPTAICYDDSELNGSAIVSVNGIAVTVPNALEKMAQIEDYEIFDIRFRDRSTIIRVSAYQLESLDDHMKLGFRSLDRRQILPICENIDRSLIGLSGVIFNESPESIVEGISPALLLSFVQVPLSQWIPLSSEELIRMDARLAATSAPAALKQLATTRFSLLRRIPANLYAAI